MSAAAQNIKRYWQIRQQIFAVAYKDLDRLRVFLRQSRRADDRESAQVNQICVDLCRRI